MTANSPKIETKLAETADERHASQRLRYEVFVKELGGGGEGVDHAKQLECDMFDQYADQLIAIDRANGDAVVGVYRLMTTDMAQRAGRFYSEHEFDLTTLKASGRRLLELGRSCVHRDYRSGTTMFQLWQALADYVSIHEVEIMFGVASFHGTEPNIYAQALSHLAARYSASDELCAVSTQHQPMMLIEPSQIDRAIAVKQIPALIKSYLRLGGLVGKGAFIDHEFNTIDVCLIMDTKKMSRQHRHIYEKAAVR